MTTIGKYELHELIGQGGFANVFRATHTTLKVVRAVKLLHPALLNNDNARQRFLRDAQTGSNLEHEHIVRVVDLVDEPESVLLAMEYLPGGDLRRWQSEHAPLEMPEMLRILGEIAAALDYAHAQQVYHRDVKPGNILLDKDGKAYLSDFGLVRLPDAPHLTQIGSVVGTGTYLSPEQAEGKEIDGRSDQYSLGVVAFELLAGRPPFQSENSTATALMHLTQPPPVPSSLNAEIPAEVDAVLLRALEKQPAKRYPDCAAFVLALGQAVETARARRFEELLAEARGLLAKGDYGAMRQKLDQARRLLPEDAQGKQALFDLEQTRQQGESYEQLVKDWQTASAKARAVHSAFPDHADPRGLFPAFGLRKARFSLGEYLRSVEFSRQLKLGLAVGLPLAVLIGWAIFMLVIG